MEPEPREYLKLQKIIKYTFINPDILKVALTHKSFSSENSGEMHNEHLEFLGDSALNLIISTEIYKRLCNDSNEGLMTKIRSALVNRSTLAKKALEIQLGNFIRLGKGEENTNGRSKEKILANAFEALIGAIYIDGGLENTKNFVMDIFSEELNNLSKIPYDDYKSIIQEYFQAKFNKKPVYKVEEINHKDFHFKAILCIDDKDISIGYGKNKKNAQKNAAKKAVEVLIKDYGTSPVAKK